MHKKILVLLTGAIALSISAVPVLASDPPTDDGQYIWQDENGDYWYRNGSEDEYIGEGNYAPDPDSGELMEGNDAGWTEQDGYFEPHYYYEDGSVWLEDATGTTYIGSRDKYYIDDFLLRRFFRRILRYQWELFIAGFRFFIPKFLF